MKSGRLRLAIYGSNGAVEVGSVVVPLEADPAVELGLGLGPELDMVKVKGGEPEGWGEPKQSEEESDCGLGGGITR